jgi:uncharacterized GH25 family protein
MLVQFKKSFLILSALALSLFISSSLLAHNFWTTATPAKPGEKPTIVVGYSDHFSAPEPIEAARIHLIQAPEFIAPDGHKIKLDKGDQNYLYLSTEPVSKGTYLVIGEYNPTYWTTTIENGSEMKPKDEVKGTFVRSYRSTMFAKGIYNVDNAADTALITKPLGTKIELIPQSNPATLKVGEKLKVQLLYDGKPLANEPVYGVVEGYAEDLHNAKAFMNPTDNNGYAEFEPWKAGLWQLEVRYGAPPEFPDKCDIDYWNAKLNFIIK